MFWVFTIALLLSGVLVFADVIKKKNPQLGDALAQIAGFSGYIGIGLFLFGILNLFDALKLLNGLGHPEIPLSLTIFAIALIVGVVVAILLGALQGIGAVKPFISNKSGIENIENKLLGIKIPLAVIAIVCSIYYLIVRIIGIPGLTGI